MSVKTTILKLILVATMHFYELQVTAKKFPKNIVLATITPN